jgi:hypothetical protein
MMDSERKALAMTHAVICAQLSQIYQCCALHSWQAAAPEPRNTMLLRQRCCHTADAVELPLLPAPRHNCAHISLHLYLRAQKHSACG